MSLDEVLVVSTKEELLKFGYILTNVNKEVIYGGLTFLLKQCGLRNINRVPYMGYPTPFILPREPMWEVTIDNLTLTVTNIH